MLHITPVAATAINDLLADRKGGGLRIFLTTDANPEGQYELRMALTNRPATTDEIVTDHGSSVFVEKRLTPVLSNTTLDAIYRGVEERYRFRLTR